MSDETLVGSADLRASVKNPCLALASQGSLQNLPPTFFIPNG